MLGFNSTTDPHGTKDHGAVAEPLSTCFLTCKRLVITNTIVPGVSQVTTTIYIQHLEECRAWGLCYKIAFHRFCQITSQTEFLHHCHRRLPLNSPTLGMVKHSRNGGGGTRGLTEVYSLHHLHPATHQLPGWPLGWQQTRGGPGPHWLHLEGTAKQGVCWLAGTGPMRRRQGWRAENLASSAAISCVLFGELQTPPGSPSLTATTASTTTWVINHCHPRSSGHPDRDISSADDEVSVSGAGFGSECGDQTSGLEQPCGDPAPAPSQGHLEEARVRAGMASQPLRALSQSGRCWKREGR